MTMIKTLGKTTLVCEVEHTEHYIFKIKLKYFRNSILSQHQIVITRKLLV